MQRRRQRENRPGPEPGPGPDLLFPLNQDWVRVRRQLVLTARAAGVPWVWVPPGAEFYPPPARAGVPWIVGGLHPTRPTWPAHV